MVLLRIADPRLTLGLSMGAIAEELPLVERERVRPVIAEFSGAFVPKCASPEGVAGLSHAQVELRLRHRAEWLCPPLNFFPRSSVEWVIG